MYNLLLAITASADAAEQQNPLMQFIMTFGMLGVFLIFMYIMVIRPQRKRDKELKESMNKMGIGDTIITIGGIVGVLASYDDDYVTIYSSVANTPIKFQRAAIQTVIPREGKSDTKKDKDNETKKDKKKEE